VAYEVKEEAPAGIQKAGFMTRALTSTVFALVWLGGVWLGLRFYVLPLLCVIVAVIGVHEFIQLTKGRLATWASVALGCLYLVVPLACLVRLRAYSFGGYLPELGFTEVGLGLTITLLFSIWGADTAAYIFGSLFGRHKLSPKLSPKKSWEGAIAGFIVSMTFWALLPRLFFSGGLGLFGLGAPSSAAFGLVIALAGLGGDLFESWLKRRAGVKDSGTILPGHGGILDRFDSLLAAAPIALILAAVMITSVVR